MREIGFLVLSLLALLCGFGGTAMPLALPEQAARERAYYQQFMAAAAYLDRHGRFPVQKPEGARFWRGDNWIFAGRSTPPDCGPTLRKAPGDRLILSFWRGEWTECYAHPSGHTTLLISVQAHLRSGGALAVVSFWLIAIGAAWGAFRLRPWRGA